MVDALCPQRLVEDAVYLGLLAARDVKPLSRLEYPVASPLIEFLRRLGLLVVPLTRIARDGTQVRHLILGRDARLIDRYLSDFDGRRLRGETPCVVRMEALYFGYPACCAEAYIRTPHAHNGLSAEDQALLFHHACPGCVATPQLLPFYRATLAEARQMCSRFPLCDLPPRPREAIALQHRTFDTPAPGTFPQRVPATSRRRPGPIASRSLYRSGQSG